MNPTIGRIVHYKLSANDAARINHNWMNGTETGNTSTEGDIVPLIIVRVWPNEFSNEAGVGIAGVNGQAILDGHDTLWVTSAREGTEPGQWSWLPRVGGAA